MVQRDLIFAIDLKLLVSQITRILQVINTCEKVIASVTSRPGVLISEYMNKKEDGIGALKKHSIVEEERTDEQHDTIDSFHFSISLHNLSKKISDDHKENIETRLVCATISFTQRTDSLTVDVAIDSPQVVLIPSIISELMFFQFVSSRLATTVDIEFHPCKISFSEQILG